MIPPDLVPEDCPWPIILGIDPGTRCAGYGAVVVAPEGTRLITCGILRPPRRLDVPGRLGHMQGLLEDLLRKLRPGTLALESAFCGNNVRSALRLGEARGMFMSTASRAGVDVVEYAPAVAKKALLGNGRASKEQVARMVERMLSTGPLDVPLDATDALSLALTHMIQSSSRTGSRAGLR